MTPLLRHNQANDPPLEGARSFAELVRRSNIEYWRMPGEALRGRRGATLIGSAALSAPGWIFLLGGIADGGYPKVTAFGAALTIIGTYLLYLTVRDLVRDAKRRGELKRLGRYWAAKTRKGLFPRTEAEADQWEREGRPIPRPVLPPRKPANRPPLLPKRRTGIQHTTVTSTHRPNTRVVSTGRKPVPTGTGTEPRTASKPARPTGGTG